LRRKNKNKKCWLKSVSIKNLLIKINIYGGKLVLMVRQSSNNKWFNCLFMKKYVFFLVALALGVAACNQGGQKEATPTQSHKRIIYVQGHPHELLTKLHGDKEDAGTRIVQTSGDVAHIDLADIVCWAGSPDLSRKTDSAVLVIKWTDGKVPINTEGDSILAWGYHWNPQTAPPKSYPVTKYTVDMIRAVANADCAFSALLQNSSGGDIVVGGLGYNFATIARVPLEFDSLGAVTNDTIKFHYTGSPNCDYAQGVIPYDMNGQLRDAMSRSNGEFGNGTGNGIIRHPFDADYGYPAYDFDYWKLVNDMPEYAWQAGWYHGYWAFYVKDSLDGPFTYPMESGIATHEIKHHSVSGLVYETNMDFPPPYAMTGNFTAATCDCGCNDTAPAPAKRKNVTGKQKQK
jgi:hypothetical protein